LLRVLLKTRKSAKMPDKSPQGNDIMDHHADAFNLKIFLFFHLDFQTRNPTVSEMTLCVQRLLVGLIETSVPT